MAASKQRWPLPPAHTGGNDRSGRSAAQAGRSRPTSVQPVRWARPPVSAHGGLCRAGVSDPGQHGRSCCCGNFKWGRAPASAALRAVRGRAGPEPGLRTPNGFGASLVPLFEKGLVKTHHAWGCVVRSGRCDELGRVSPSTVVPATPLRHPIWEQRTFTAAPSRSQLHLRRCIYAAPYKYTLSAYARGT